MNMKMIFYIASLLLTLAVIAGCHDDSPAIPDNEIPEEEIRANRAVALLGFFCKTESDADGKVIYTPDWGTVLYEDNPTVRYVVADDLDDARRWFSYFVQAADPNITQDVTEYKIEGHGSIRFTTSTTADRIATIRVDFAVLPEVKEFVFIAKDRWPGNNISPFDYGAVYYHEPTGYRYVCIAGSRYGTGTLITFDKKKWDIQEDRYPNWSIIRILGLPLGVSTFEQLRKFMYNYNRKEKRYVKNELAVGIFEEKPALAPKIYSNLEFICDDGVFYNNFSCIRYCNTYVISSDHSKTISKDKLINRWVDPVNPDFSDYILSKIIHFESNASPSFIAEFRIIFHP